MLEIGPIIQLAKAIYEQVRTVQSNHAQCQRLVERLKLVEASLSALEARSETPQLQHALLGLKKCVEQCLDFVKQFSDNTWYSSLRHFAKATGIQNKFGKLSQQLGQACTQLELDIQIAQLVNHDQDLKDRATDQAALLDKLDEIVRFNQQELMTLDVMSEEAKAYHDETQSGQAILQKQVASLSQHIQAVLQAKPKKTLIDKHLSIPFYETGQFQSVLGQGAFATVYQHRWCEQSIAVKLIDHRLSEAELKQFSNEVITLPQSGRLDGC